MTVAVRTGLRQGSDPWIEARRTLITSTDVSVLLGVNPWKCEADLADEKLGVRTTESTLRMRVGTALEDLVAEEYTSVTGRKVQRVRDLVLHPNIEWAGTSPDRRVIGERRAVEIKTTQSRTRFADGIPDDVQAQVQWTLGVLGWDVADVAVLVGGQELLTPIPEIRFDPRLFADLVVVAEDFRRRLDAGGPFSRDLNRIRRENPADDGTEIVADEELIEAAHALVFTRGQIAALEALEEQLKTRIQDRMGSAAHLIGPDFRATWKRTKDREETNWKSLAEGLLRLVAETERDALVGLHTSVRAGQRPFRLVMEGSTE